MRASKPSCSAMAVAATLRLSGPRAASSHGMQTHSADGIIGGCHTPLARQELPFVSTLRREDR